MDASSPHREPADDVVSAFGSDPSRGLTAAEAGSRRERYGPNELAKEAPIPAWRRFLEQFRDVLVILLLAATAISAAMWVYERDEALPYEAIAILAVVLFNATLGYVQQARAEAAVAALRAMTAADATVIRDGQRLTLSAAEIVPGDIILIEEGDDAVGGPPDPGGLRARASAGLRHRRTRRGRLAALPRHREFGVVGQRDRKAARPAALSPPHSVISPSPRPAARRIRTDRPTSARW